MEDELRLGDPGTSTPPHTSPTTTVGEHWHSIRGSLGQREREQKVALSLRTRMNSVSQVMGALELLDPEARDPSSAYGNEPLTSGWKNQTHQQHRLGEVLGDSVGEYDDARDQPTTVERRSSNVHTNHPALAAAQQGDDGRRQEVAEKWNHPTTRPLLIDPVARALTGEWGFSPTSETGSPMGPSLGSNKISQTQMTRKCTRHT